MSAWIEDHFKAPTRRRARADSREGDAAQPPAAPPPAQQQPRQPATDSGEAAVARAAREAMAQAAREAMELAARQATTPDVTQPPSTSGAEGYGGSDSTAPATAPAVTAEPIEPLPDLEFRELELESVRESVSAALDQSSDDDPIVGAVKEIMGNIFGLVHRVETKNLEGEPSAPSADTDAPPAAFELASEVTPTQPAVSPEIEALDTTAHQSVQGGFAEPPSPLVPDEHGTVELEPDDFPFPDFEPTSIDVEEGPHESEVFDELSADFVPSADPGAIGERFDQLTHQLSPLSEQEGLAPPAMTASLEARLESLLAKVERIGHEASSYDNLHDTVGELRAATHTGKSERERIIEALSALQRSLDELREQSAVTHRVALASAKSVRGLARTMSGGRSYTAPARRATSAMPMTVVMGVGILLTTWAVMTWLKTGNSVYALAGLALVNIAALATILMYRRQASRRNA